MRYFAIISLLFLLESRGYAQSDVSAASWALNATPSVAERNLGKDAIAHFIHTVTEDEEAQAQIGAFRWVDLDGDKSYELVVSVDYSGRAFFNNLYIVKQRAGTYGIQKFFVSDMRSLNGAIEDLNNDSTVELILRVPFSEYRGARPVPIWTAVYKWNGVEFVDSSRQFPEFYKKRILPTVELRIKDLTKAAVTAESGTGESDDIKEEIISAETCIKDKIARTIGDNPTAGIEQAQAWAKNKNPNMRANAIAVFADMNDVYFTTDLEALAADADPSVAEKAKHALARLKK